MKSKISKRMFLLTSLSVVITTIAITLIYYKISQNLVIEDLRVYSSIIRSTNDLDTDLSLEDILKNGPFSDNNELKNLRVTIIKYDGTVITDTHSSTSSMNNHSDRPEVLSALKNGDGYDTRQSDTIDKNTIYYAINLDNGYVLRVAKETSSIVANFIQTLPILLLVILILLVLGFIFTHFLTKQIIKPISDISCNLEEISEENIYIELKPFIETINRQNNMRRDFTTNVSHELKTPLTVISGYSDLISNGIVRTEDTVTFAKKINKEAKRLLVLINDIIELSKLDTGVKTDRNKDISLNDVALECIRALELTASNKHISLDVSGDKAIVHGDYKLLYELIYNLCDNAIKYNHEYGVVYIRTITNDTSVILSVKDTGIGIAPEHQNHVFERFYRVDKSHSKETGGTGLGLSIVKHIAKEHNAQIEIKSRLNMGTEIIITFPKS